MHSYCTFFTFFSVFIQHIFEKLHFDWAREQNSNDEQRERREKKAKKKKCSRFRFACNLFDLSRNDWPKWNIGIDARARGGKRNSSYARQNTSNTSRSYGRHSKGNSLMPHINANLQSFKTHSIYVFSNYRPIIAHCFLSGNTLNERVIAFRVHYCTFACNGLLEMVTQIKRNENCRTNRSVCIRDDSTSKCILIFRLCRSLDFQPRHTNRLPYGRRNRNRFTRALFVHFDFLHFLIRLLPLFFCAVLWHCLIWILCTFSIGRFNRNCNRNWLKRQTLRSCAWKQFVWNARQTKRNIQIHHLVKSFWIAFRAS